MADSTLIFIVIGALAIAEVLGTIYDYYKKNKPHQAKLYEVVWSKRFNTTGTVVHVYNGTRAYEIDFGDGHPIFHTPNQVLKHEKQ